MALKDYTTSATNKILIGSAAGIGLIITAVVGLSGRTPAYQTRDSSGQNTWGVTVDGTSTQSGTITTKSLISCDTIDSTSTGMLICGDDQTGAGATGTFVNTGALLAVADDRYVNTSGDTMTGALKVRANLSGSTLNVDNLRSCDTIDTDASGGLICGTDDSSTAVGSANIFYLDTTESIADNYTLSVSPSSYAETANAKTVLSSTSPVFFERFVSGPLGRDSIPAGLWSFDTYAATDSDAGTNEVLFRINKRVAQTGMTGTFTGAGTTRTFTVTGGTPFVSGDASTSIFMASLIETPTQTAWISGFTSSGVVTVTLTDPAFVNVSNVSLDAIYYYLFDNTTGDVTGPTPALYTTSTVQPEFTGINLTDRIVAAYFGSSDNDAGTDTMRLYYGGTENFSHFQSPLSTLHNDLAGLNVDDYLHLTATQYSDFLATGSRYVNVSGDTMTGALVVQSSISGSTIHAEKSLTSSGALVWEGAASGSSLYLGTSLQGAGLVTCSNGTTSKLLWNSSTGRFSCGTDQGTSYTAGQGLTLTSTSFKTNSTLTGSLTRFNTSSGYTIYAKNTLASSGTLKVLGNMSGASLNVNNLKSCVHTKTDANGAFSCDQSVFLTADQQTAGQGLTLISSSFKVNATLTGTLVRFDTLSGSLVKANRTLASSGTIVAEGTISGANIYSATSFQGSGLVDCSTAGTSKLLWTAASGRFSCGTDTDTNTTYTAGRGLGINGTVITLNATITGSLVRFDTVSGSLVRANRTLASSGTIVAEGAISGASLYTATSLQGAGLVDCATAGTSKLLWTASTGRFSCGTDQGGSFGTGNVLTIGNQKYVSKQGDTMTGALVMGGNQLGLRIPSDDDVNFIGAWYKVVGQEKTSFVIGDKGASSQNIGSTTGVGFTYDGPEYTDLYMYNVHNGLFFLNDDGANGMQLQWDVSNNQSRDIMKIGSGSLTYFVISASGKVGLNKSTPKSQLDVAGTISGSVLRGTTLSGNILKTGLYSPSPATVELIPTGTGTSIATGSGRIRYTVPKTMSGFKLYDAQFTVDTAGTTNVTSLQIRNLMKGSRKLFSTVISVDSAEKTSETAATPFVISAANADVSGGDYLYVDFPSVSTTAPKGANLILYFYNPR